jgi:hypothetical protein
MPEKNNINVPQLKQKQTTFIDEIERLKEEADEETIKNLEEIERNAWAIVMDLDEIAKRQNNRDLVGQVERNTILFRMRESPKRKPEKLGNYYV